MEFFIRHGRQGLTEGARLAARLNLPGGEDRILNRGDIQKKGKAENKNGEQSQNHHCQGVIALDAEPQVFLLCSEGKEADKVMKALADKIPENQGEAGKVQQPFNNLAVEKLAKAHDKHGEANSPRGPAEEGSEIPEGLPEPDPPDRAGGRFRG